MFRGAVFFFEFADLFIANSSLWTTVAENCMIIGLLWLKSYNNVMDSYNHTSAELTCGKNGLCYCLACFQLHDCGSNISGKWSSWLQ